VATAAVQKVIRENGIQGHGDYNNRVYEVPVVFRAVAMSHEGKRKKLLKKAHDEHIVAMKLAEMAINIELEDETT